MPFFEAWLSGLPLLGTTPLAGIPYSDWAFANGETLWGTFQTWDLSAKKQNKAPEGAASEDEEGQGTLVKHAMSDDPLILRLISSSTTRLVISFSSRKTPDVAGAATVPEKHLASHSEALVRKLLPILPCRACFLRVLRKLIQHRYTASSFFTVAKSWCANFPNAELCNVLSRICTFGSLLNVFLFYKLLFNFLACGFVFVWWKPVKIYKTI